MLKVENVYKQYSNQRGVKNLSFQVGKGKVCAILGSNGCGKTTTFRLLLQLLQLDKGSITYQNEPIYDTGHRLFGYVPEERSMLRNLKVEEQVYYLGRLKKMDDEEIEKSLVFWLSFFRVSEYRNAKIMELSKGNQQKIQMVCALLHDPEIVILDEPLNGLDVNNVRLFKELLTWLRKEKKTVLISSHQYHNIEHYCDQVVYLKEGEIVFKGDVNKIKQKYAKRMVSICTKKTSYSKHKGVVSFNKENEYLLLTCKNKEVALSILQKCIQDEIEEVKMERISLEEIIKEKSK